MSKKLILHWLSKYLKYLYYNKSKSCRKLADYLLIGEEWADCFLEGASYPPVLFEKAPYLGPSVSILKIKSVINNCSH